MSVSAFARPFAPVFVDSSLCTEPSLNEPLHTAMNEYGSIVNMGIRIDAKDTEDRVMATTVGRVPRAVHKFGGTSVQSADAMRQVREIIAGIAAEQADDSPLALSLIHI